MNTNYFNTYDDYQRIRLRYIIIKLIEREIQKYYKENNEEELEEDFILKVSNIFFNKLVKPKWFKENDIKSVKEVYDYIEYSFKHWETQKQYLSDIRIPILYKEDIINEYQKNILKNIIEEIKDLKFNPNYLSLKYKQVYKGQPIQDMDINYISKNNYDFIYGFLMEIKKIGRKF